MEKELLMHVEELSVKIAVPTYNAGAQFHNFIKAVLMQNGLLPDDVLVVDSCSTDQTAELARKAGFDVQVIFQKNFSHGGTRAMMVERLDADIVVFLTQDAVLANENAVRELVLAFRDEKVGAAYGRQLPTENTSVFGAFARSYNYGPCSFVNELKDREVKGIKTAFLSDSFAAYRKNTLLQVGNFGTELRYGEDTIAAAKLLLAGDKTAYCANALVYHAHSFTLAEEFARYYETGKLHKQQHWLLEKFGKAEGEGLKYVLAEVKYLNDNGCSILIPLAFLRNVAKFAGYKFGYLSL